MGMYDTIVVDCPKCGEELYFQSKSGECCLAHYSLDKCPEDVLYNANRHSPIKCECGESYSIDIENRILVPQKK